MKRIKKSYNTKFLSSKEARTIRILCEYIEPEKRLSEMDVRHTVVFFGSARIKPGKDKFNTKKYYWEAEELAFKLASWSNTLRKSNRSFHICTGGGPGIMEAANRGAKRAKADNIGLNISLPFEQIPNQFITHHYFFMRKLWFLNYARALVVFPGGFGTLDELFEVLTLKQNKKIENSDIPILLYDREYWESFINFDKLVELNLISSKDLHIFSYFSSAEEGFELLKPKLEKLIDKFS
jgi:uncharacterized protein (TIGR00730 family)